MTWTRRMSEVDLEPFQRRFAESSLTVADVVRATGLEHSYLSRMLGKTANRSTRTLKNGSKKSYTCAARTTNYDTAFLLAKALDMDFHEAGV